MRKKIIAGNWKMKKVFSEAQDFLIEISEYVDEISCSNTQTIVCPPALFLEVATDFAAESKLYVGAQNVSHFESGAHTGEISAAMLSSLECDFCIVGHSERRKLYHETDEMVNKKIILLLQNDVTPIVCVGETLEEREIGIIEDVIVNQLEGAFRKIELDNPILLAYEPVWAIGTGKTASPQQAQEVHSLIRSWLIEHYGQEKADDIPILYGGSVNPENAKELLQQPDIDGGLIGGASLDLKKFKQLIDIAVGAE
jgi:triosephosphate isomerase (TIM)